MYGYQSPLTYRGIISIICPYMEGDLEPPFRLGPEDEEPDDWLSPLIREEKRRLGDAALDVPTWAGGIRLDILLCFLRPYEEAKAEGTSPVVRFADVHRLGSLSVDGRRRVIGELVDAGVIQPVDYGPGGVAMAWAWVDGAPLPEWAAKQLREIEESAAAEDLRRDEDGL